MNQINVEFGSGGNRMNGWIHHDMEVDITKPLPYADGSVDKVKAEHLCEHVSGPDFLRFLDECYRILKHDGTIRICMPVLDELNRTEAREIILNHGHLAAYTPHLISRFLDTAGFKSIVKTQRNGLDFHWQVIGKEKDDRETARFEARKQ